jgi:hypothetical protein
LSAAAAFEQDDLGSFARECVGAAKADGATADHNDIGWLC